VVKSPRAWNDEAAVALSFPDDFPFNRRPSGREAQMKPQEIPQEVPQPQHQAQDLTLEQPQVARVRPAVPPGAPTRDAPAAAAAMAGTPMPAPVYAEGPVPVNAKALAQSTAPAPVNAIYPRANERRRSPRQTLVAKAVVRSEFNQNTVATGFLSNISMLGVGFHTRRPLAVGEKFQMRLELGPMRWATRLRVVSCQPHDSGTYDVGAEFIGNDLVDKVQRDLAA
jgi:hypothetical protein